MLDDRTALTRQEQRALAEIERHVRRDDPKLASFLTAGCAPATKPTGRRRSAISAIVLIAVLAVALAAGVYEAVLLSAVIVGSQLAMRSSTGQHSGSTASQRGPARPGTRQPTTRSR